MSELFKLSVKDLLKGLVVAVLTAILASFQKMLEEKGIMLSAQDGRVILKIAISAGTAYLIKNFVTDENNKLGGMF